MRFPSVLLFGSLFFATISLPAEDELPLVSGLSALPEIEFTQLSQQDLNPLGAKALALHSEQWKHGETEHFIYHFTRSFVATPVSVEAEFHYRVVAKVLERDQPPSNTKSHIYIFDKSEDWQMFQTMGQLERNGLVGFIPAAASSSDRRSEIQIRGQHSWPRNLASRDKSFLLRRHSSVARRRIRAVCFERGARQLPTRARLHLKPHSQSIAAAELIPLPALVAFTGVPNDRVDTFYDESERLGTFSRGDG